MSVPLRIVTVLSLALCLWSYSLIGVVGAKAAEADPTLGFVAVQKAVLATLKYHSLLKSIQENRQAAVYELDRAKSGYGPRLDLTGQVGGSYLNDSTTRNTGSNNGLKPAGRTGLTLTQPLWTGGATKSQVETASRRVDSLDYRVLDNASMLALETIIAYVDINRRRVILDYAQRNVKQHKDILGFQEERASLGASTQADITQIQGRLARAYSQLTDQEALLRDAEEYYLRLTGLPAPASLPELAVPDILSGSQAVLDVAQQKNSKLLAYLEDVKLQQAQEKLSEAAYQPNINLELGPNYSDRGGKGSQWVKSFDTMLVMRWNLFNSGGDVAQVQASKAKTRELRAQTSDFRDSLTREVRNTWTSLISAQQQERHYQEAVKYNLATRNGFLEQFKLAERSLLDVLDAAAELYNSAVQLATAKGNVRIAAYRLDALSGELLDKFAINRKDLLEPNLAN